MPDHRLFRADIEGLRGVAVLLVIQFHAKLGSLDGGFVGVDIFFVISGYLMHLLLRQEVAAKDRSFLRFYARRVRRILPALLCVVFASLAAGAILLTPNDLEELGKSSTAVLLLVSNIFFWHNTSYFDAASEVYPLLHMWSLSIEEQFYILFPIIILLIHKISKRYSIILCGIGLASLAASLLIMPSSRASSFYMIPFRMWEFILGALVSLAVVDGRRPGKFAELIALAGLSTIIISAAAYTDSIAFPGLYVLLPCIGTAALLWTGDISRTGALFLENRVLRAVGRRSYSLYLWHWPVLVFAAYYNITPLSGWERMACVGLTVPLAEFSWRFIEEPFRRQQRLATPQALWVGVAIATAFGLLVSLSLIAARGVPQRFSARHQAWNDIGTSEMNRVFLCSRQFDKQLRPNSPCSIGASTAPTAMLWGDSHANALFGALNHAGRTLGMGLYNSSNAGCPPTTGIALDVACIEDNARRLRFLAAHPEVRQVILAARWAFYPQGNSIDLGPAESNANIKPLVLADGRRLEKFSAAAERSFYGGLRETVDALLAMGKTVILVYPVPEVGYDVPSVAMRLEAVGRNPEQFTRPKALFYARQARVIAALNAVPDHPNLKRIRPSERLCPIDRCLTFANGQPLYIDDDHLSGTGSVYLAPLFVDGLSGSGRSEPWR